MPGLKSFFIPHIHSKRRSRVLQTPAFIGYISFLLLLILLPFEITSDFTGVLGYAENISIGALLDRTNSMRTDRGLNPLTLNTQLSKAAEAKANDMFAKNYWAHNSPDGKEPWDFIIGSGYDYLYAGENLAVDFNESGDVVEAWYNSVSHRENLLSDKYTEIGFAVVNGELEGRKTTLVVQMFGYPRVSAARLPDSASTETAIPVEIIPETDEELAIEETFPTEIIPDKVSQIETVPFEIEPVIGSRPGAVLDSADVFNTAKYMAILLGLFLSAMFVVDGFYVKRMGIYRVSGHTFLHILMLIAAIFGVWYTQIGLVL